VTWRDIDDLGRHGPQVPPRRRNFGQFRRVIEVDEKLCAALRSCSGRNSAFNTRKVRWPVGMEHPYRSTHDCYVCADWSGDDDLWDEFEIGRTFFG
jgi:hypothetical protein